MISVNPVVDNDVEIALGFLTQHLPAAEQREQIAAALESAESGELSLDGLLLARRKDRPVGVMFTILQTEGIASLWPPEVAQGENADVADALMQTGIERLSEAGVSIMQAIVECDEFSGRQILTRNGLPYLTDLVFMERPLNQSLPDAADPELEFVTYQDETHDRFVNLLRESYRATFDCPELDGVRTAEQALAGHRATGEFDPEFWRLFRLDGRDVGVLLISAHSAQQAWELVYMGVVPEARGVSLGRRMLTATIPRLCTENFRTIFLAVDTRNRYALNAYERLGFVTVATRALHLQLPGQSAGVEN